MTLFLQCLPKKESSSLHSTLLTGFSKPSFAVRTEISKFSRKLFQNLVVHDFTLLLTPFESKLTDSVMNTDHLDAQRNCHFDYFLSKMEYFVFFDKFSNIDSPNTNRSI